MIATKSACAVTTSWADQTENTIAVKSEMKSIVAKRMRYHGLEVRIFQPVDGIKLDLSDCETIINYSVTA
jgi:hypothetical protein